MRGTNCIVAHPEIAAGCAGHSGWSVPLRA
jgi:hypothetical protein